MTNQQRLVKEWMTKAGQATPFNPTMPLLSIRKLRYNLIAEELEELNDAHSIIDIADALGDLDYVVKGSFVAYGLDDERIFEAIHKSNMSKFIDGHRRSDGKWMKGPSYVPADLNFLLNQIK